MNAVSILGVVAAFSALFLSAIIWCARKGFLPSRRELKKFGLLSAIGYFRYAFASNLWSHTRAAGAGIWADVDAFNRVGGIDGADEASIDVELPPMTSDGVVTNDVSAGWMNGALRWEVPFGWNIGGTRGETAPIGQFALDTIHEFTIGSDGSCTVEKLHNKAERRINGKCFLNGAEVYDNSN